MSVKNKSKTKGEKKNVLNASVINETAGIADESSASTVTLGSGNPPSTLLRPDLQNLGESSAIVTGLEDHHSPSTLPAPDLRELRDKHAQGVATPEGSPRKKIKIERLESPIKSAGLGSHYVVVHVGSGATLDQGPRKKNKNDVAWHLRFNGYSLEGDITNFCLEYNSSSDARQALAATRESAVVAVEGVRAIKVTKGPQATIMSRKFVAYCGAEAVVTPDSKLIPPPPAAKLLRGSFEKAFDCTNRQCLYKAALVVVSTSTPYTLDGTFARDVAAATEDGPCVNAQLRGWHATKSLPSREGQLRPLLFVEDAVVDESGTLVVLDSSKCAVNISDGWPIDSLAAVTASSAATERKLVETSTSKWEALENETKALGFIRACETPCSRLPASQRLTVCAEIVGCQSPEKLISINKDGKRYLHYRPLLKDDYDDDHPPAVVAFFREAAAAALGAPFQPTPPYLPPFILSHV